MFVLVQSSGIYASRIVSSFDADWLFYRGDLPRAQYTSLNDSLWRSVQLPHDWSIEDIPGTGSPFSKDAVSGVSGGFTVGGTGWYRKHFTVNEEHKDKRVFITFDGIYMNADIWVNNRHLAGQFYGYSPLELDITEYVVWGKDNLIAVRVKNEGQNSRWYTGSGIYRHTFLRITAPFHIVNNGITVTTPEVSASQARMEVRVDLNDKACAGKDYKLCICLMDAAGKEIGKHSRKIVFQEQGERSVSHSFSVKNPQLWSVDHPVLYKVVCELYADEALIDDVSIWVGIRSIDFSAEKGFLLNGVPLKLKGGCIHHDNGPLGAKAFERAEERKIEQLKAAGFNALRLSHNPPSATLLDACDRLGMLVIDEAFDMWRYGHYKDDYAQYFDRYWKDDLSKMIERDKNHPSVIMWSIGNEIPNKETDEIVEIAGTLSEFVRKLDPTRPVTAGVNAITDECDRYIAALDVCGYNYCLNRYETDHERSPQRIIYGSESYPSKAYEYWKAVEKYPWVIGDFVWTAYDYIGEASIGWCGYPLDPRIFPWNHANCGDFDICGYRRPQSYYRETLWSDKPVATLAVAPPVPSFPLNPDKADWSVWDWKDMVDYWCFPGYENVPLTVSLYTNGERGELFLNGKSLGIIGNGPDKKNILSWNVPYEPGELKAVVYKGNKQVAKCFLRTAGEPAKIRICPDRNSLRANGQDLSFLTIELVDKKGNICISDAEIHCEVNGGATLEALANSNPMSTESFTKSTRKLWRGRALAIVRAGRLPSSATVTVGMNGISPQRMEIEIKE